MKTQNAVNCGTIAAVTNGALMAYGDSLGNSRIQMLR